MTTDSLPARWVILASAGLACALTGLAIWISPEWTAAHLFVPVLLGVGLPPVVALGAGLRLWWASEQTRLWLDGIRGEAQQLANQVTEAKLALEARLLEVDDDQPDDTAALNQAWALALETFFRAGQAAGSFSIRALAGVIGSTAWGQLTDFYCSPAGRRVLRVESGDVGTVWGHGWGLDYTLQQLALGKLPHPDMPVPEVQPFVASTTQQRAQRQRKTAAGAVVEGVAREVRK